MGAKGRTLERAIARIAGRQDGNVTRKQLLGAGLSSRAIQARLDRGLLIRQHRGVYRVGHAAQSTQATYRAAVLACGDRATLVGPAAAHHLRLTNGPPPPPEVATPTERSVVGIANRRTRNLDRRDTWVHKGIRTTTPAAALVALAASSSEDALARAVHEAHVRYRTTSAQVESVLKRHPTAPGAAALRRILRGDSPTILSRLEKEFLELLDRHKLPLPLTNRPAGGRLVDCRWPEHRLTVELDSYRYHATRHAFEQDRKRERDAYRRGDDFRRYTYADVVEDPADLLAELASLLR
jgi:hypothetical protein